MNAWIRKALVLCTCAVMYIAPLRVMAADGQINFSGGVLAPTCTAGSESAGTGSPQWMACDGAAGVASGNAAAYVLEVKPLGAGPIDNRLLDYFAGYLGPGERAHAEFVTRTYR